MFSITILLHLLPNTSTKTVNRLHSAFFGTVSLLIFITSGKPVTHTTSFFHQIKIIVNGHESHSEDTNASFLKYTLKPESIVNLRKTNS